MNMNVFDSFIETTMLSLLYVYAWKTINLFFFLFSFINLLADNWGEIENSKEMSEISISKNFFDLFSLFLSVCSFFFAD